MPNKRKQKFYPYFLPITGGYGIVKSWSVCKAKTSGVKGARFKAFNTLEEAEEWLVIVRRAGKKKPLAKAKQIKQSKSPKQELEIRLPEVMPNSTIKDFAFEIYFDGACEPKNPGGTASYGWLIKKDGKIIEQDGKIIGEGEGMTNNVGEYTGLIKVLERFNELGLDGSIMIHGDSKLVCSMVSTEWGWSGKKKTNWAPHKDTPHLAVLLEKVFQLLKGYDFAVQWIPREQNQEADDLSKKPLIEEGIFKLDAETKKCQACGAKLVIRQGKFGSFYGCSRYPKCKSTEKLSA